MKRLHAVTGAFGYSGKYIALQLLNNNQEVISLTNSFNRNNIFNDKVKAFSFNFDNPELLAETLKDVKVLYNTYWVRFNHKLFTHAEAVKNTKILFEAAKQAGVEKIVHISITNPSANTHLEYFSGKYELEQALINSGISYSILRPTVIFGREDILINNIAWVLRKFPIVAVFGDGQYKLQPIFVDDLAKLAVEQGNNSENIIIDAIGPETYTYNDLLQTIGKKVNRNPMKWHVSDRLGFFLGQIISFFTGDVLITKPEIEGLKANLLFTLSQPAGTTKLSDWIEENKTWLGKKYANEIKRRKNITKNYLDLQN